VCYDTFDLDCDGARESVLEGPALSLFWDDRGGALVELDVRSKALNLIDTLSRREEPYYPQLAARSAEAFVIIRDWYRRGSFVDHFLHPETTLARFAACDYGEQGDFVDQPYTHRWDGEGLTLAREGGVWVGERRSPVTVVKQVRLAGAAIEVLYRLWLPEEGVWFGVELNGSLTAGEGGDRLVRIAGHPQADPSPRAQDTCEAATSVTLIDGWAGLEVVFSWTPQASLWRFPIETLSQSEGVVDRIYQSTVLMPHWKLGGPFWEARFRLEIRAI